MPFSLSRSRALLLFSGLFLLIAILMTWAFFYDSSTRFLAGTNPPRPAPPVVLPRMPPLRPTDAARGQDGDGVVTVVEFSNFTCPSCRASEAELLKVQQEYGPKVRVVWRDLPLGQETPATIITALAGRCAKDQGKFWQMHDLLFQASDVDVAVLRSLAVQIGLNPTSFSTCMSAMPTFQALQDDLQIANTYDIKTAPVFFIGREVMAGYVTALQFKASIDRAVFKK